MSGASRRAQDDPEAGAESCKGPLYIDLDGTLVAGDLLWESFCGLLRQPAAAWRVPWWLASGRAVLKRRIAERSAPDPSTLPYRDEVLTLVRSARAQGRRVVLTTASDRLLASSVAQHLGLFDAVLASDGAVNLKGEAKRDAIVADCGGRPFSYAGDSVADLPIWERAEEAILVAPTDAAMRGAEALPARIVVTGHRRRGGTGAAVWRAMRPYQWSKNLLYFVPLILAQRFGDLDRVASVAIAFWTFCAVVSATYVFNDFLDLDADRHHPRKRNRPFAAGALSIPQGFALMGVLLAAGFGISLWLLPLACTGMLALYVVLTILYSTTYKERLFVDVLFVTALFTHRVLAGGVAADVIVSPWLLAFSVFFFLSLALVKRYAEILALGDSLERPANRRDYAVADKGLVESMGLASGFVSVLVLCLYVNSSEVVKFYPTPALLWLTCPVMLYWVGRMWFLARRGIVSDDPVLFAIRDRASWVCGALIALVAILAANG